MPIFGLVGNPQYKGSNMTRLFLIVILIATSLSGCIFVPDRGHNQDHHEDRHEDRHDDEHHDGDDNHH